ncbi:MAG: aminodeoxychorismate synthase component I [Alphaproteobacteria bacterium]|nr:aminodeoxychorismate synthase component I [Alphaproteobacteria bacterium]
MRPGTILFDDSRARPARAYLFENPREWLRADEPGEVAGVLAMADDARRAGRYVAGTLAYELGYVLEDSLRPLLPAQRAVPLVSLGVYDAPRALEGAAIAALLGEGDATVTALRPRWSKAAYEQAVARVKQALGEGAIYQANLTFPIDLDLGGRPAALFAALRRVARVPFGALMIEDERTILSLSPELFLESDGKTLRTRPMKGTAARAPGAADDEAVAAALPLDAKQRAENLMIVDLLRNDLTRIAVPGSVRVEDLFTVERYPTFHAMTSGVAADLRPDASLAEILAAVFPCGSVTGAPKIAAMREIRALEEAPRGVYCGALGWAGPEGCLRFNVAIRTLTIEKERAVMPVGAGLVWDSDAVREYDECLLKARVLTQDPEPFHLIETMRWSRAEGTLLLPRHLARLAASARYFDFPWREDSVRAALDAATRDLGAGVHRLRLTLDAEGTPRVTAALFEGAAGPLPMDVPKEAPAAPVILADTAIDSMDPHRHHKTSRRAIYDEAFARASAADPALADVLFFNERGELAEGSRTNVFIKENDHWITPPLSAGALAGVLRAHLLDTRPERFREGTISRDRLLEADAILIGNALRGLTPVRLRR